MILNVEETIIETGLRRFQSCYLALLGRSFPCANDYGGLKHHEHGNGLPSQAHSHS